MFPQSKGKIHRQQLKPRNNILTWYIQVKRPGMMKGVFFGQMSSILKKFIVKYKQKLCPIEYYQWHTSYASLISWNFSAASAPLFVSGWYFFANWKKNMDVKQCV